MNVKLFFIVFAILFIAMGSSAQVTVSLGQANLHAGKTGLGIDGITGSPNLLLIFLHRPACRPVDRRI
jgi:hypothetical protein